MGVTIITTTPPLPGTDQARAPRRGAPAAPAVLAAQVAPARTGPLVAWELAGAPPSLS